MKLSNVEKADAYKALYLFGYLRKCLLTLIGHLLSVCLSVWLCCGPAARGQQDLMLSVISYILVPQSLSVWLCCRPLAGGHPERTESLSV